MRVRMKTRGRHGGEPFGPGDALLLDEQEAAGWIARDLATAIEAAEGVGAEADRESLLARAKELGLSPRANTPTAKLIAAIEAAEGGGAIHGGNA